MSAAAFYFYPEIAANVMARSVIAASTVGNVTQVFEAGTSGMPVARIILPLNCGAIQIRCHFFFALIMRLHCLSSAKS